MTTSPDPTPEPEPLPDVAPEPSVPPPPPPAREPFWRLRPKDMLAIGALALVGLVVMGLLANSILQRTMESSMGSMGESESDYTVTRTDLSSQVTLSGTIQPTQRLDLSFTSPGEVTSVSVSVGDDVAAGTRLASIDDADLRETVSDASAEVSAARTDYTNARRSGTSSEVTALRSALAVKEQALKDAQAALDQATLVSTIDGVIAAVNVRVGDTKGEGAAAAPAGSDGASGGVSDPTAGQADVVVISRTFQVDATVGGSERARLSKGQTATVTVTSSTVPLTGTITGLGVVAQASQEGDRPGAASFPVTVTLEGDQGDVFAGTSATVVVDGGGATGVLAIPTAAVLDWGPDGTGKGAQVLARRGADPEPVQVDLGANSGDMVEVLSGLEEGDVVVIMGFEGMPGAGAGGAAAPAPEGTP